MRWQAATLALAVAALCWAAAMVSRAGGHVDNVVVALVMVAYAVAMYVMTRHSKPLVPLKAPAESTWYVYREALTRNACARMRAATCMSMLTQECHGMLRAMRTVRAV